jgi:hypothetical protein
MGPNQRIISFVYISTPDHRNTTVDIDRTLSVLDIVSVFKETLDLKDIETAIIKLYNKKGELVPIGPNIPENDENTSYNVSIKTFQRFEVPKKDIENSIKAITNKLEVKLILIIRIWKS